MTNAIITSNPTTELYSGTLTADLFARWTAFIDASPKTVKTYTYAIKQFYKYLQAQGISSPTREDVIAYKEDLKQTHKATTVQGYIAAVKLFFSWTEQEGLYPNIANHVKGVKLDREHKKDYLTETQAKDVLAGIDRNTLKGKRDYAIISLMLSTGLRTISVRLADIEDIRPVGNAMGLYYQGKGHNEKAKYVRLEEPVEQAIRDYLKARGAKDGTAPLFASISNRDNGERMTTRSISRIAKDSMVEVGLESDRLTAHSLRHTFATINIRNGGSIEETQEILDHSNINTTMIYAHTLEREKNQSESRVAGVLFG